MPANLASIFGLGDIRIDNPLVLKRYSEVMNLIERDSVAEINSFRGRLGLTQYNSKLLNLLNVRFILCPPGMEIPEGRFVKVYDKEMTIYENREVLPRAFAVSEFKIMKERKDILKALSSPGFEIRKQILLEENPMEWKKGMEVKEKTESRDSGVWIEDYKCKEIRISARMKENGFLVLSDMFYPGWRAYVDGVRKKIYCADYILRAIYLPKGDHEILFSYEPISFKTGFFISLSTICLILSYTCGILILNILNRCRMKPKIKQ